MKKYLTEANTDKVSHDMENEKMSCGISSMQGWRARQEDAHICILDFDKNMSLFGVFDGHGGAEVALYAAEQLPNIIKNNESFKKGDYENALKTSYMDFDSILLTIPALKRMKILRLQSENANGDGVVEDDDETFNAGSERSGYFSGCTAVIALLVSKMLYVANVGDSRCVVATEGLNAFAMTKDHKPNNDSEFIRIHKAGGIVSHDGRISHDLNMSRAFGDHKYKNNGAIPSTEQMVIALPEIKVKEIKPENGDYIILGCDGVWESLPSQCIVNCISKFLNMPVPKKLSAICEEILDICFTPDRTYGGNGLDNMTCIIVKFKHESKINTDSVDNIDGVDGVDGDDSDDGDDGNDGDDGDDGNDDEDSEDGNDGDDGDDGDVEDDGDDGNDGDESDENDESDESDDTESVMLATLKLD